MIKIENTQVVGLEAAIRGMRNPMDSWEKSDSIFANLEDDDGHYLNGVPCIYHPNNEYGAAIGPNDLDLMRRLAKQGPVHGKFRRMIMVYVDITAPLYWWKEFDTYKVGTVANSCSTMHKIHDKEFTPDDFSHEHLICVTTNAECTPEKVYFDGDMRWDAKDVLSITIEVLNHYRQLFLKTQDKRYWWQMIQLLPSSYNQKRTVMLNYEVLAGIYPMRKNHKLDEWHEFCRWIEALPYSEIIIGEDGKEDK